jgi:hypothetical protein
VLSKGSSLYTVLSNKLIVPEPVISFEFSYLFTQIFNYSATSKQLCYTCKYPWLRNSKIRV